MRILRYGALVAGGLVAVAFAAADCGGATDTLGGRGDASADGRSSSSGGGSSSASSGSSSSGGSGSSSGASSSSSGSGSGGGSSSGGGGCNPACTQYQRCCGGQCVDPYNDPQHCGSCATQCDATQVCEYGQCRTPPCYNGYNCGSGTCCGSQCCSKDQICCEMDGPVQGLQCFTPTDSQPTCPGGCAPACVSDRNVKRDVEPVDPRAVLESVARMPISTWSCRSDDPSVRHMGPMAQDFYAEFGLGGTDEAYSPIDAHGAAFAAIQGLYERLEDQETRIDRLEKENDELRRACVGR